jgi:hypothetical protein
MKRISLILLFSLILHKGNAQTFAEWTQQKKTQIKYLQQQIVGLQIYATYLQKGYKIVGKGLSIISDIKNADFNLHNNYFNSLKLINRNVKKSPGIAGVISLQLRILKIYQKAIQATNGNSWFTGNEVSYIQDVFTRILSEASDDINQLMDFITPNYLIMKDDERVVQIDNIYEDMTDKQSFAENFSNEIYVLGMQRLKESQDIKISRLLNQIR